MVGIDSAGCHTTSAGDEHPVIRRTDQADKKWRHCIDVLDTVKQLSTNVYHLSLHFFCIKKVRGISDIKLWGLWLHI